MKRTIEFDLNTMLLYGILEGMTMYNYDDEIEIKLQDFINFLADIIYKTDDTTPTTDIVSQKYYYTTTYKKELQ